MSDENRETPMALNQGSISHDGVEKGQVSMKDVS
jgi:hypothetical protein